jgi:hypothetical protein
MFRKTDGRTGGELHPLGDKVHPWGHSSSLGVKLKTDLITDFGDIFIKTGALWNDVAF